MFPRAAFRPLLAAAVLALTVGSARAATADMLSPEGDSDTASPLTGEDKAEAIAEAREMVANATAAMNAAQSAFAAAGGVEAAAFLE